MLLQEIRARQALQEANRTDDVTIRHAANPATWINGVEWPGKLLFPKRLLDYNNQGPRKWDLCFVGKLTPKRREFLQLVTETYRPQYRTKYFEHSVRGRRHQTRNLDLRYFNFLGDSKFAVCPNGDFVWTYRFFEAVICGAVPIIESDCDLYQGYYRISLGQPLTCPMEWVDHNLAKVKEEMML